AGPNGEWTASTPPSFPPPHDWAHFRGHYLHGPHVVLSYTVGDAEVLESHGTESGDGGVMLTRTLEVGPSQRSLTVLVSQLPAGGSMSGLFEALPIAAVQNQNQWMAAALVGPKGLELQLDSSHRATLTLPPSNETRRFKFLLWRGPNADFTNFIKRAKTSP